MIEKTETEQKIEAVVVIPEPEPKPVCAQPCEKHLQIGCCRSCRWSDMIVSDGTGKVKLVCVRTFSMFNHPKDVPGEVCGTKEFSDSEPCFNTGSPCPIWSCKWGRNVLDGSLFEFPSR